MWNNNNNDNNIEDEVEDLHKREEELQAELNFATLRVNELKKTLEVTKSFIKDRAPTRGNPLNPLGNYNNKKKQSNDDDDDFEEEDDEFDFNESDEQDVSISKFFKILPTITITITIYDNNYYYIIIDTIRNHSQRKIPK